MVCTVEVIFPTQIECHDDCETCRGPTNNDCFTCSSPSKVMYQYKCIDKCPVRHTVISGICYGILSIKGRVPLYLF